MAPSARVHNALEAGHWSPRASIQTPFWGLSPSTCTYACSSTSPALWYSTYTRGLSYSVQTECFQRSSFDLGVDCHLPTGFYPSPLGTSFAKHAVVITSLSVRKVFKQRGVGYQPPPTPTVEALGPVHVCFAGQRSSGRRVSLWEYQMSKMFDLLVARSMPTILHYLSIPERLKSQGRRY